MSRRADPVTETGNRSLPEDARRENARAPSGTAKENQSRNRHKAMQCSAAVSNVASESSKAIRSTGRGLDVSQQTILAVCSNFPTASQSLVGAGEAGGSCWLWSLHPQVEVVFVVSAARRARQQGQSCSVPRCSRPRQQQHEQGLVWAALVAPDGALPAASDRQTHDAARLGCTTMAKAASHAITRVVHRFDRSMIK